MTHKTPHLFTSLLLVILTTFSYGQHLDSLPQHTTIFSAEFKSLILNSNKLGTNSELSQIEKVFNIDLHALTLLADSVANGKNVIHNYSMEPLKLTITQLLQKVDSCPNFLDSITFSSNYLNKVEYDKTLALHNEIRYIGYSSLAMTRASKREFRKFEKRHPKDKHKLTYPVKSKFFCDRYFITELKHILNDLNSLKKMNINHITIVFKKRS